MTSAPSSGTPANSTPATPPPSPSAEPSYPRDRSSDIQPSVLEQFDAMKETGVPGLRDTVEPTRSDIDISVVEQVERAEKAKAEAEKKKAEKKTAKATTADDADTEPEEGQDEAEAKPAEDEANADEQTTDQDQDGDADSDATGFLFMGKQYKTQKDAEQRVRTLQAKYNKLLKSGSDVNKAAWEWKREAERLSAQLSGRGNDANPPKTQAKPTPTTADPESDESVELLKSIPWDEIETLAEEKGLKYGMAQALLHIDRAHRRDLVKLKESLTKEQIEPMQNREKAKAEFAKVGQLWTAESRRLHANGKPLYPELTDANGRTPVQVAATAEQIARIWQTLSPEVRMTPRGFKTAVMLWREERAEARKADPDLTDDTDGVDDSGEFDSGDDGSTEVDRLVERTARRQNGDALSGKGGSPRPKPGSNRTTDFLDSIGNASQYIDGIGVKR